MQRQADAARNVYGWARGHLMLQLEYSARGAMRHHARFLGIGIGHQDHELVAAVPSYNVAGSDRGAQRAGFVRGGALLLSGAGRTFGKK